LHDNEPSSSTQARKLANICGNPRGAAMNLRELGNSVLAIGGGES